MFCKYEIEWHKISLFFGLHAYHPIERPTENNVWGTEYGRCTFVKCFEKVRKAKAFCRNPHERLFDTRGNRFSKRTGTERIEGQLVETFKDLKKHDKAALLRCQSSENLSFVPSKSVDAVITDPPYFDNVQYSELADFFYVWLRIGLKDHYPWFQPELSSCPAEIVKNDKLGKTTEFFNKGLMQVFKECHRVLKDDGIMAFTFHHNKTWAWEGIAQILLEAGFYISVSPIVRSEGKSGFHSSNGNIRYDCVLVCRKRPSRWANGNWSSLREHILKDAVYWTRRTFQSGMPVNEVDIFTVVMGKTIEFYTKAFPHIAYRNKPLTLSMVVEEMKNFIDHVAGKAKDGQEQSLKAYKQSSDQLALFIRESESLYDRHAATKLKGKKGV
jgi:adenine-specific DNA methylase